MASPLVLARPEMLALGGRSLRVSSSAWLGAWLTIATATVFLLLSNQFLHWFVLPLILCGCLIGKDAVDWLRGRVDLFDPAGIIGIFGYYFFFVTPMLQIYLDYRIVYVRVQPDDYRPWVGAMAVINAAGILIYRFVAWLILRRPRRGARVVWELDSRRFLFSAVPVMLVCAALQGYIYMRLGGIEGYIASYTLFVNGIDAFRGMGWQVTIAESFPILAVMFAAVYARRKQIRVGWLTCGVAMAVVFAVEMLFGGLRGSRINILWGMLWAAGILHLYVRRVTRGFALTGVVFMAFFMYLYGFYKSSPQKATLAFAGAEYRDEMIKTSGRTPTTIMLSDFARSTEQAFLLYRTEGMTREWDYAKGGTYLGAIALIIPRTIWPERPPTKVKWTTEVAFGPGTYEESVMWSSMVYGIAGEAILNFGPYPAALLFAVLGISVGLVRRAMEGLPRSDPRMLMFPFFALICLFLVLNDSDNVLFMIIKYGAVPGAVIMFSSSRRRVIEQP